MQEEQDTCRICSAPAEPEQPLFYPCKCSGTIRYIHQDCLTTWLAHSKKKTCDVCKHPYSFEKVYAPDMPSRLPLFLLFRRFAQQSLIAIIFAIRVVIVGLIWGALLPWATIWTWRMYFAMGDSTAWWISNHERPIASTTSLNVTTSTNATDAPLAHIATLAEHTTVESFLTHPTIRTISADIVAGQIIATIIVVAFVAIFLLREWITQNARPGVFDDADAPPELVQDVRIPVAADPPPGAAPDVPNVDDRDQRPAQELAIIPADAIRDTFPDPDDFRHMRRVWPPADSDADANPEEETKDGQDDKGKRPMRKLRAKSDISSVKRRHSWNEAYSQTTGSAQPTPIALEPEQKEFTFRTPAPTRIEESTTNVSAQADSVPGNWKMDFSDWNPLGTSTSEQKSSANILSPEGDMSRPLSPAKSPGRPPLFSTALFSPAQPGSPPHILPQSSRASTPLSSPSLATYRAPEEFEPGSSNLGYFPAEEEVKSEDTGPTVDETIEDEWDIYFPESSPEEPVPATQDDPAIPDNVDEEEREFDSDMPGLQLWTDDEEADEEEDALDAVVELEGPEDVAPLGEEEEGDAGDNPRRAVLWEGRDGNVVALEMGDEFEAGMEDDMEGALEDILAAIGLRGPIYGVIQNAALMIFVLDTTIGIGVWLPFTVGKSLALLSLEPRRLLYLIDFPIRAIRILTDPIVDAFMLFLSQAVLPPLKHVAWLCLRPFARLAVGIVGEQMVQDGVFYMTSLHEGLIEKFTHPTPQAGPSSLLEKLAAYDSRLMVYAEPYFAPLGEKICVAWGHVQEQWIKLALGDSTTAKIFAISLGYIVDAILLAIYLNILTIGSMKSAGRAVRSAVRQQLLVVKVAAFILVELVVFPLGCGIMLDICTAPLFPSGSFNAKTDFLLYAPLTSAFYHWVIGTMFMYQFAVLLAGFRTCLRPGAMWFIKDPQDQNFHPIREILERPTFVHIKKLILSGVMYAMVVACSVGTIAGVLRVFSRTIMPFRWKVREPLSVVPIDLLFLHLVLPYTLQYFKPRKILRQAGVRTWKYLASQLRLSSYLFGVRPLDEEVTFKRRWHLPWEKVWRLEVDGSFRRVPNSDNVVLVKNEAATAEVDAHGKPIGEKAAQLIELQNAEAEKARRNWKDDYTVVYIPPHFRYRIIAFTSAIWLVCSAALGGFLGLPILLGRYFFRLFIPYHVHDGYSFLAGFYLLWACWLVSRALDRMDKQRQRRGGDEPRADFALYIVKRGLLWLAQAAYMAFCLGVVIPTLISMVIELYIILPSRHAFYPDVQLRIRVVDMWALGLLYTKVALGVQRIRPAGQIVRGIEIIRRNGWTHLDPIAATKNVIAPLTAGLVGMILVPPAVLWSALRLFKIQTDEHVLFLHVYPGIFILAAAGQAVVALAILLNSWSQTVRDKEFLLEMRLQNLEQDNKGIPDIDEDDGNDEEL